MTEHSHVQKNHTTHCNDTVDSLSNCCASACSMISAIISPDTFISVVTSGRSLQRGTEVLPVLNHPVSSLYRPPIL